MKRVKNSDIKFKINKKLVYLPNFVIRFYTVNQKEYFFEKTQDDLVEYEREATVDDVEVILSGGTTVTEYYLPLNWSELLFVGQGILNYKLTNNIEDPEFPDYQYNKEEVVTTDFYIDSIKVNPEPEEGLIERVVHLEEHLAEEIVNREEADAAISGAVDTEIARAVSAETALQEAIDAEETRATSAETALNEALQAETNRAISAETALDTKIDQEIADRTADVDAEEARAISAETALDAKIDAETTRATAAEAALDTKANTISGNVISETTRATTAENALSGAIDSISAATSGSVEELDAKIDTVSGNVITEEARAKGVEDILSGAIDTIDAKFIDDAKYEMSGQTHVINFYNGNTVKASIDCTDFLVDGMIDNVYIENGYLVIDFNTASGKQDIRIPLTDIFNPNNYYTKSETSGATEIANALAEKLAISDFNTYSGAVDTAINSKASQSTVDALNGVVTAHIADDSIHFTTGAVQTQIDNSISGKVNVSDNVVSAYSFDKSTKIKYDITAEKIPSIPLGIKKISIGFTMLPANNQLFEKLQLIKSSPFGFADVASGLTVGVSEDKTTFPITYTVTSVTWTGDDNIMTYDLSENDTLLNLYAQEDYQFTSVVPKGINLLEMYIDVLEDIESGQTAEVVNDGVIKNFENVGKYLHNERDRVNNELIYKLDATAYTPTIVDSSLRQGSAHPVENGAIYDEVRVQTSSGGGETTLIFDENNETTNYPLGTTEFIVWADTTKRFVDYTFYNDSTKLGNIIVAYFDTVKVTQNTLPGATYTISGEFVTFTYQPLGITKIVRNRDGFVEKVINPPTYTSLKSVVDAKQDQLIAGENIIISGNVISSEGGGKAIEAGRGISITTGETADTVSFNLPISAGTGTSSIVGGQSNSTEGNYSFVFGTNNTCSIAMGASVFGERNKVAYGARCCNIEGGWNTIGANAQYAHSEGCYTTANTSYSHTEGLYTIANNKSEHSSGQYNVSNKANTTFGDSGNTLFSVGNGTSNSARHNAFEIRQNGDIYLTKDGQDIKLQDALGGGGGGTVESAITSGSTNAVESKAIWSATTYNKDVLLTFNGYNSTNYPQGCTKIKVEDITNYSSNTIYFNDDSGTLWSNITISNMGSITVDTTNFQGASYEISGTTVIISYPTVTTVTKLNVSENGRYTYKAVVEGAWIADNTYMKEEVDAIQNTLQNNINQKLDATAYTPVNVDSALNVASTNPVENQALYSELRIGNGGETETTIEWSGSDSTNYPQGCTKIKVEDITTNSQNTITFNGDNWANFGNITINNWGSISVDTSHFQGASYEIDGSTVIISYPTVTNVTKIQVNAYSSNYTYKAITTEPPTVLKDQVVENTAALATKQNQLTAGTGISIIENVISVTGGTGGGISSAECQTMIAQSISGKTNQTDFVSHSGNTTAHITSAERTAWNAKSDFSGSYNDLTDKPTIPNYTAGSGITISNNVISAKIWSGTEAQYNALAVKDNDTIYLIYNS